MNAFNTQHVSHIYATLSEGRGTLTSQSHPFAVYMVDTDGNKSQEMQCRDLRDCLLVGNGMAAALMAVRCKLDEHNVRFDPRFTKGTEAR